jgi:hypothetical protein
MDRMEYLKIILILHKINCEREVVQHLLFSTHFFSVVDKLLCWDLKNMYVYSFGHLKYTTSVFHNMGLHGA